MASVNNPGDFARGMKGLLLCGLLAASASASAWWNSDWPYRKEITVNAPAAAAGDAAPANLANVPVLVRLHEGVFPFSDAKPDGADIRFVTQDDETALNFHIEKFDPVFNMAQIWVQVPALEAGKPVPIWMYYGNENAEAAPDTAAATYDEGQVLVYHFSGREEAPVDTTANRLTASTPVRPVESGLIGAAAAFDGKTAVLLPASPLLSFLPTTEMTLSFWVKSAATAADAVIYTQRDASGSRVEVGLRGGAPYVGAADEGGVLNISSSAQVVTADAWHHVAVVAGKSQIQLFVDGKPEGFLARVMPAITGVAMLGGDGGVGGAAVQRGFRGEIDEFSLADVARSPAWIALAALNQGAADTAVQFGADEQQASFSSGYVGIIMGSVTLDGWIVIGVLIVMMFISWAIMVIKGLHVSRVSRANDAFLAAYRASGGDLARLHRALLQDARPDLGIDADNRAVLLASPVWKMFDEGISELQQRIGHEKSGRSVVLSSQSIEAIRAALNAVFIREQQLLSKRMVLLTIAISGGPFLGLLGTVVGVMITFAAVAASGDVNVNAIAPGIAAALAATVAGLFVAIPALFGYNYLISRVKECTIEMQVFVDVFVTKIAENYNDSHALHALADE